MAERVVLSPNDDGIVPDKALFDKNKISKESRVKILGGIVLVRWLLDKRMWTSLGETKSGKDPDSKLFSASKYSKKYKVA